MCCISPCRKKNICIFLIQWSQPWRNCQTLYFKLLLECDMGWYRHTFYSENHCTECENNTYVIYKFFFYNTCIFGLMNVSLKWRSTKYFDIFYHNEEVTTCNDEVNNDNKVKTDQNNNKVNISAILNCTFEESIPCLIYLSNPILWIIFF